MTASTVRRLELRDIPDCERILRSLPEWFGIESANQQYIRDLETLPAYVAEWEGRLVGFLAINQQTPDAAELHIIAVLAEIRGTGIGQGLLDAAETDLRAQGVSLLQVKTLGPSNPDDGYRQTREFYEMMGFLPLEETTAFWGPDNPTLVMVKVLRVDNWVDSEGRPI
jgi:N-acetylglutamate synthase-like GNAT family acetyltransferase